MHHHARRVPALCALALLLAALAAPTRAQTLPIRPTPVPETSGESRPTQVAAGGRITGTVIDRATGAPAPGVAVTVGDMAVTTDVHGNYARDGMPAGSYAVAVAGGDAATVAVTADATVVQHLAFGAAPPPADAAPAASPTALPTTAGTELPTGLLALLALALAVGGWALRRRASR